MNDFVAACRGEWRRLGVADAVADEMAAELAADLEEAEREGAAAEEVLGSAARDPRTFAAAWAAERGVIPQPPRRPSRVLAAIGTLALAVAIVGAVLSIVARSAPGPAAVEPRTIAVGPPPATPRAIVWVTSAARFPAGTTDSDSATRIVGTVLLFVGLAALAPLTLFWSWVGAGRPRRPAS